MNHWDAAAAVLMKTRWESARERAQEPRPHTSYQSHQTILTHFYISVQIDEMKNLAWLVQPNCCLTEALTQRLEKSRRNVKLRLTAVSSSSFCLTLGGVSSGNTLYSLSLPPPSSCFKAAFARSSHRCWIRRSKPWFDADKSDQTQQHMEERFNPAYYIYWLQSAVNMCSPTVNNRCHCEETDPLVRWWCHAEETRAS